MPLLICNLAKRHGSGAIGVNHQHSVAVKVQVRLRVVVLQDEWAAIDPLRFKALARGKRAI
jgi:hypothetical protein